MSEGPAQGDADGRSDAVRRWCAAWKRRELELGGPAGEPLRSAGVLRAGLSDLPRMSRDASYAQTPAAVHLVMVTLVGDTTCTSGGLRWELGPASAVIFPRGAQASFRVRSELWRVAWFVLDGDARFPGLDRPETRVEHTPVAERLAHAIEGMFAECGARPDPKVAPFDRGMLAAREEDIVQAPRVAPPAATTPDALPTDTGYLYACIVRSQLARVLAAERADPQDEERRIERLWARVRASLERPWAVEDLAAEVGVSTATLHRLTRKLSGTSPGEMLLALRMQRARTLLAHTSWPLKRMAESLGYRSRSSFSMAFKRHTGSSPRSYRRSSRPPPAARPAA